MIDADLLEVDEHVMRVGSSIDATITTYALKSVLLAPQQSVFYRDNQAYVQKIESGRRVDAPVELGQKSANLVVVMDGLDAGDLISVAPKIDSAS